MSPGSQNNLLWHLSKEFMGVFVHDNKANLLHRQGPKKLFLIESQDGFNFTIQNEDKPLLELFTTYETPSSNYETKFSRIDRGIVCVVRLTEKSDIVKVTSEKSENLKNKTLFFLEVEDEDENKTWKLSSSLSNDVVKGPGVIVSDYQIDGKYLMIWSEANYLRYGYTYDLKNWEIEKNKLHIKTQEHENSTTKVDCVLVVSQGLLVIYHELVRKNGVDTYYAYYILLNARNPRSCLWHSENPVWQSEESWNSKKLIEHVGTVLLAQKIISYWSLDGNLVAVRYPFLVDAPISLPVIRNVQLDRPHTNPIIVPRLDSSWECFATLNPAAVLIKGKVYILYRAQNFSYLSTIGLAISDDGVSISERLSEPIYKPSETFETMSVSRKKALKSKYRSAGGVAGCEDPRTTVIGDTLYMTYVAYDGATPPRSAITSINVDAFLARRWDTWTKPVLISRPGIVDKSCVIFPEKINGKYCMMHRIFPNIQIDYLDDLNFDGHSKWLEEKAHIPVRKHKWDSRKIGAGAPPLKTDDGWLLIYYGVDDLDGWCYKVGAMLLDLEDPAKVLYRCDSPVLSPEEWYENSGFKPGILYPCGAVIIGAHLYVYYGGADNVVCVATAHLKSFLTELKNTSNAHLDRAITKGVFLQ